MDKVELFDLGDVVTETRHTGVGNFTDTGGTHPNTRTML